MGKKYIIELEDTPIHVKGSITEGSYDVYKVKGFDTLMFILGDLQKLNYCNEEVMLKKYEQGKACGYEERLAEGKRQSNNLDNKMDEEKITPEEVWETIKKICFPADKGGISSARLVDVFGTNSLSEILHIFSYQDVISKIREIEEKKQEIRVGDEVIAILTDEISTAVVTNVDDKNARYIYANGTTGWTKLSELKKTGRHFLEIEKLLEAMKK